MTPEDIPSGLRLCRASGWNQTETDWAMLLGSGTFRAAVLEDKVWERAESSATAIASAGWR